jgi:sterol desaturase/sphingolipid hydroxylase (fatty acid hydroxylase superfamily)
VPLLLVLTVRGAFVPEGWAPHGLLLTQVGSYAMAVGTTVSGVDWATAVVVALAVLATHLSLSLLAAWPPRAPLPRETLARTTTAFGVLGSVAVAAGLVGALAGATPDSWAAWLVPAAVIALAVLLFVVRGPYERGVRR